MRAARTSALLTIRTTDMAEDKDVKILATVDTIIPEPEVKATPGDSESKSRLEARQLPYLVKGKGAAKLTKNEDPEVRDRYNGIRYEVFQFSLWSADDMKKYAEVMTDVGTDPFTSIAFHDRVYIQEKQSWKVLLELAHYVQVVE